MTHNEIDDTNIFAVISPLHFAALKKSIEILSKTDMLHSDALFGDSISKHSVIENCFNPARAAGDGIVNGHHITTLVDNNIITGMEDITTKPKNTSLNDKERSVISLLILSSLCDGAITPGFALFEMYGNKSGRSYIEKAFSAFSYLCSTVELDDLCIAILTDSIPEWKIPITSGDSLPKFVTDTLAKTGLDRRQKSEIFASICAAIVEKRHSNKKSMDDKFSLFIDLLYSKGTFALGSLRYYSLYFSDALQAHGIPRGTMLKSIHSKDVSKAIHGVMNASADCYFASEYASSINTHSSTRPPRVFATYDKALQLILKSEFEGRDNWNYGISTILSSIRNGKIPSRTAEILDSCIPTFKSNDEIKNPPPLRETARWFLNNQQQAIDEAWNELKSLYV